MVPEDANRTIKYKLSGYYMKDHLPGAAGAGTVPDPVSNKAD